MNHEDTKTQNCRIANIGIHYDDKELTISKKCFSNEKLAHSFPTEVEVREVKSANKLEVREGLPD
jgi:hypothetical protein